MSNKATVNKDIKIKQVSFDDFAESFGTTSKEIETICKALIKSMDFSYYVPQGVDRDAIILEVLRKLDQDKQVIGAQERTDVWEKGWRENLNNFKNSGNDLNTLIPKFIRPGNPIRFKGEYIIPTNANFELDYYSVFRFWLFNTYFKNFKTIYEFGCGTGFNLIALAQMFPEKELHGSDFVVASKEMIDEIAKVYHWNLKGYVFDMIHPDKNFPLKQDSLVFTSGAIEQLASKFDSFLDFLLARKPGLCVHIEPTVELYDENTLIDYLAAKFHRKRGYTQGFLPRLEQLEASGRIELLKVKRLYFGSLFMEGFNLIIWRLK